MAGIEDVRRLVGADRGLAVVTTQRADGTMQASVVNAGVLADPVDGRDVVAFVARGDALKLRHLRARPDATVVFRAGWQWIAAEGTATIIGPDDPRDGFHPAAIPGVLRHVFVAAGGIHDDWDEFDRVMAAERRAAVLVTPARIYGNG
jgi:PPOX class probable F420-dependent enzyme